MEPFEEEEGAWEPDEDPRSIDQFYRSVSEAMEPFRVEMILEGGDIRLAGVSTDGRVFVRIRGREASVCQEKRMVLKKLEKGLKATLPKVRQVIPVCPPNPLGEDNREKGVR